ncbi:SRPBCC family protein [Nocardioides sp. KIGAM211]|uniref:SRPBCC family protein n=1 Tax=Nocardioides luti TaxID=2761101 RepID=A0A7X0VB04_9ACTN|nr:SRPBCC family protein [Nocardioides luti]MBB6626668.1 SRPBCC family protein [Nocardioides luti]
MSSYTVSRSTTIDADRAAVHALVVDLQAWQAWSPWEGLDDDLQRTYTGPEAGVGAHYAWSGNRKAGRGSMEVVRSTPEEVGIRLEFLKPFRSTSDVVFTLVPRGEATEVTWTMSGEQTGVATVFAKVVPMDKLIGKDFERGLAQLKATAEA